MAIVVEDEPTLDQLREVEVEPPDTIYGIYEGIPLPERQWNHGNVLPDKITIYSGPLLRAYGHDRDLLRRQIRRVVLHEVAHHFGISDERLRELDAY